MNRIQKIIRKLTMHKAREIIKSISMLYRSYSNRVECNLPTIYACSTGLPPCGISVIRISGENAQFIIQNLTKKKNLPSPRMMTYSKIYDPLNNEAIDEGMVVYFPKPNSFTGEDCAELHVHGSKAVINKIYNILSRYKNTRIAGPGEFTKRSFLNNKIDLTKAEGIYEIINAETEIQRKEAISKMTAKFSIFDKLIDMLNDINVDLQAYIEFNETEGSSKKQDLIEKLSKLKESVTSSLSSNIKSKALRTGIKVAIVGKSNAGKSTLFNHICGEKHAITSNEKNTTRDTLLQKIDFCGYPVQLLDTAGIFKKPTRPLDCLVQNKTFDTANEAHLLLYLINGAALRSDQDIYNYIQENAPEQFINNNSTSLQDVFIKDTLLIVNKQDLIKEGVNIGNVLTTSCTTLYGINKLKTALLNKIEHIYGDPAAMGDIFLNEAEQVALTTVLNILNELDSYLEDFDLKVDVIAQNILSAMETLSKTRNNVTPDVLDGIFNRFCIGK